MNDQSLKNEPFFITHWDSKLEFGNITLIVFHSISVMAKIKSGEMLSMAAQKK